MSNQKQTTWGGRFAERPADLMLQLGESVSFDQRLAPYDISCSRAHASMLAHVGLITAKEAEAIRGGLDVIGAKIAAGAFEWNQELEDVHMNIEHALRELVPAGAKLHTARSRNDQVATDMRLYFKETATTILGRLDQLRLSLLALIAEEGAVLIPGYTHLQRAQPVSVAHYLLAYLEMFGRDADRFQNFREHANWCPLGSGALAGTTLPIDREWVARELGFVDGEGRPRVTDNSLDAISDRDLFLEFASAAAITAVHLSRMAEDFILWNTAEFGFVVLPDTFTTGSSLMPQKKNPDAFELIRGKAARIQGHLSTLHLLMKGQAMSYNRDLQEDKPPVFDAADQLLLCLEVVGQLLPEVRFRRERCAEAVGDPMLLATDLADYLVEKGVAFRDAHHRVGALVKLAEQSAVALPDLSEESAREACPELGSDWRDVFNLERSLERRSGLGMPSPKRIRAVVEKWERRSFL